MHYVVIAFLCLSILLYLLLGGADFGAGIMELFTSSKNRRTARQTMSHAIGPIWEANHMWLIIAVVILFVGFPRIYSVMSVSLHIPLLIMLLGIIARGTAFVFRHYDAVKDQMQAVYNRIFVLSSAVTPFFLGVIAASVLAGYVDPAAPDFLTAYVFSWLHWFAVAVGVFTVALCGYLASVYSIGEAENEADKRYFIRKTLTMTSITFTAGGLVFVAAAVESIPLWQWIFGNIVGTTAVVLATISLGVMAYAVKKEQTILPRILAGFQVTMILLAIGYRHFPDFIVMKDAPNLSLLKDHAPAATMSALGWALLIGSLFILPALYYLYYSFQHEAKEHSEAAA
ncbi:cytochrome d ubiquinol oxidase subunit II [Hymenobacter crusticola]|uniref:Cytochrome D ubiquinol oxidase subunit II n=1 Tax=Hymenobacter crusticola TaxID=1770526 RepID=A0A243WBS7_9BACT|nr:cytochrome d ubiquinol oxidase subunit II [Hymenobacter crusticola]OUJ73090.1 cytochrome D ubiquinol oxidase subunit II [Hymenobacter crusticola]